MESISLAAYGLLKGGYDLHIHSLPSALDRQLDDIQVFKEADRAEMAGILLKNHGEPTGSRAWLLNRYLPLAKVKAYGAAVLNWSLGGLNPLAVQTALALGARIIFMPTVDAANFPLRNLPGDVLPRPGIRITDPDGNLRQEVRAIFQVVKVKGGAFGHRPYQPGRSPAPVPRRQKRRGKNGPDPPGMGPYPDPAPGPG